MLREDKRLAMTGRELLGDLDFSAGVFPELIKLIVVPLKGGENVKNYFTIIEKHPACVRSALGVKRQDFLFL